MKAQIETDFDQYRENFILNLKAILKNRKISWKRLCADTGIHENGMHSWRHGYYPHLTTLIIIADYFGISIDELIGRKI